MWGNLLSEDHQIAVVFMIEGGDMEMREPTRPVQFSSPPTATEVNFPCVSLKILFAKPSMNSQCCLVLLRATIFEILQNSHLLQYLDPLHASRKVFSVSRDVNGYWAFVCLRFEQLVKGRSAPVENNCLLLNTVSRALVFSAQKVTDQTSTMSR